MDDTKQNLDIDLYVVATLSDIADRIQEILGTGDPIVNGLLFNLEQCTIQLAQSCILRDALRRGDEETFKIFDDYNRERSRFRDGKLELTTQVEYRAP